jgi:hypothetical protein
MNDLYTETIERQGRIYRYDPDHDCYYAVYSDRTLWDQYGWLAVVAVLTAIALYFEFFPIR